jgi:hypothetical protein
MRKNIKVTKREVAFGVVVVSLIITITVSVGSGCVFAFCAYTTLTA